MRSLTTITGAITQRRVGYALVVAVAALAGESAYRKVQCWAERVDARFDDLDVEHNIERIERLELTASNLIKDITTSSVELRELRDTTDQLRTVALAGSIGQMGGDGSPRWPLNELAGRVAKRAAEREACVEAGGHFFLTPVECDEQDISAQSSAANTCTRCGYWDQRRQNEARCPSVFEPDVDIEVRCELDVDHGGSAHRSVAGDEWTDGQAKGADRG